MTFCCCIYLSYQNGIMFSYQTIKTLSKLIKTLLTAIVLFKNKLILYWFFKHPTEQCDHICIRYLPVSLLDGKFSNLCRHIEALYMQVKQL